MVISDKAKTAGLGAVAGAVVLAMVGYSWDFMLTPGEAEEMARRQSQQAVATAIAPFCVEKFQRDPNASAKLAELKKIDQWSRASYIEKGGWAKPPGPAETSADQSQVAAACAESLVKQGTKPM